MKTINWIRDEHKDRSFQFHLYKTSEAGAFELYLMPNGSADQGILLYSMKKTRKFPHSTKAEMSVLLGNL